MRPKTRLTIQLSLLWGVTVAVIVAVNVWWLSTKPTADFEASNGVKIKFYE